VFDDPLHGVSDANACVSFAHRLRQHVATPREIVAAGRTVVERLTKDRPDASARLPKILDAYDGRDHTESAGGR
jgi:hypothetical protein